MHTISIEPHPLAALFPMMSAEEIKTLAADIKENGLREPIIVYEGQVLDGRNRYRACLEIGIEPMTRPWDGKGSPLSFVVSKNLIRRHLDDGQRADIAARIANIQRGGDRGNQHTGGKPPIGGLADGEDETQLVGVERAAELMNVSVRSVERARGIIRRGVPELEAAVMGGGVSLSAAEAVSYLPHEEQREIVAKGPDAIVKAAKVAKVTQRDGPKLSVVQPVIAQPKTVGGSTISIPDGMTVEDLVRKGMALEAIDDMSADKTAKQIGISVRAYRNVRDLIILIEKIELTPLDRKAVSDALAAINETRQLASYDAVEPIVRRVWGSNKANHHSIRTARKRVDHFATVAGIAVQSCANLLLDEFEIPYLTEAETRRWIGELEQARRTLDTFLKTLRSAA